MDTSGAVREHSDNGSVKVLYILGTGRSGTTILHNILGQIDGFAAVGELRDIWQRGVLGNWLCGCQQPFQECPVWQKVFEHAFGGVTHEQAQRWYEAVESFRDPHMPQALVPPVRQRHLDRLGEFRAALTSFYKSLQEVTNARVIVDSSKNPSYGYLLQHVDGLDVRFLHFVRDAPAVAYSWSLRKEFEPGKLMARKSPQSAAMQWVSRNALSEAFFRSGGNYKRMRYEDFLIDPRAAVGEITAWVDEPSATLPFDSSHEAVLSDLNHSVFGNPVRFAQGPVTLRRDERWREAMSARDARIVKAIALPTRVRYGYLRSDGSELEGAR